MLLRQVDRRTGLTAGIARVLGDERRQARCRHDVLSLSRQRVYGLLLGYEDLNDHDTLRKDLALQTALQTAVERDERLVSSPTLCRFEKRWSNSVLYMKAGVVCLPDMVVDT